MKFVQIKVLVVDLVVLLVQFVGIFVEFDVHGFVFCYLSPVEVDGIL